MIFVDGVDVGDIEDVALRDRRMLSADGIFIVVATISEQDGRSVAPPEIIFRGVPFVDESDGFVEELRDAVDESLARSAEEEIREIDLLQDHLHDDVAAVRLRPPEAPADDPAGRRRGLARRQPASGYPFPAQAAEPPAWATHSLRRRPSRRFGLPLEHHVPVEEARSGAVRVWRASRSRR